MANYKEGWFCFFLLFHFVMCTVFGWDRFHFLRSSSYGTVFWICDQTVLVTHWRCSCCWTDLAQHQGLFYFSCCPTSELAGGAQEVGRGCSRDSWPQLTKGIFHTMWHQQLSNKKLGKRRRKGGCSELWHLSSQDHYTWWSPAFLEAAKHQPADGK